MTTNTNAALRTIADWPITDPANMDAVNMAQVARAALTTAAAVPVEGWWKTRADEIELEVAQGKSSAMRCYTDMRALLQAATAPKVTTEPPAEPYIWGYAVRNPKEPACPARIVETKDHADRVAIYLYEAEIIPLADARLLAAAPKAEPVPAGEYPPLPTGSAWCGDDDVRDFGAGPGESALMFEPTQTQHVPLFTAGQMRAYVDADRAMRAQAAPAAVAGPSDEEMEQFADEHLQLSQQFGRVWVENGAEFVRAVLARWGTAPATHPAAPVALGDVAAEVTSYSVGIVSIDRVTGRLGTHRWAVRLHGEVLNKQGEWEREPQPSSRDEAFFDRCRFDTAQEAIAAARSQAKEGA